MNDSHSLSKQELEEAASLAEGVIRGSAFRLPTTSAVVQHDPSRLLIGTPLGLSEIEAGLAVKRRIKIEALELELSSEELPSWLNTQVGKTILLLAEAGEGKTTFTNLLCQELASKFVILNWKVTSPVPFDHRTLQQFHDVVRSRWTPQTVCHWKSEEPVLLVIGEVEGGLGGMAVDEICSSLSERTANPDPSIVLITGRPAELHSLLNRIHATTAHLLPLNDVEVKVLCDNLQRAYLELNKSGVSEAELKNRYPNLLRFLNLDRAHQTAVLLEPQKPLIAGLLQAVYGEQCWGRLLKEFELLQAAAQTAYMSICLAASAGESVPEEFLLGFLPDKEVNACCHYSPWVRAEDGTHTARHKVIAQTVLEESRAHTMIRTCLEKFLQGMKEGDITPSQAWRIFNQIAWWEPIAPERMGHFKGQIRRLARQAIEADKSVIDDLKVLAREDYRHLLQWASTFHALLGNEKLSKDHLFMLKASQSLLREVKAAVLSPSLSERVQYYSDKNERDTRRVEKGQPESLQDPKDVEQLSLRVKRWSQFMTKPWCGPDFFADLFLDAERLAHTFCFPARPETLDADETLKVFVIAAKAFENLRLQSGDDERITGFDVLYSGLIGRFIYVALPTRKIDVLREAWKVSADTGNPNPRTGVGYARLLIETSSLLREDARSVIGRILEKHPGWGDALMLLVSLIETEEQRIEARKRVQAGFNAQVSGLSLAILNHAAARLERDPAEREKFLRLAVQGYDAFIKNPAQWEAHGHLWQEACQELRELTKGIPTECTDRLKKWRSRTRV